MDMTQIETKLDTFWMPRLVQAWRRVTQTPGPETLTEAEIARVGAAVRGLSEGLTKERALVGVSYMDARDKLGAYLLYYWPRSYVQCSRVLGSWEGPRRRVLDLGAGPGPMSMAAVDWGAEHVASWERAGEAVRVLKDLGREVEAEVEVSRGDARTFTDAGGADLVILGHVVNELWSGSEGRVGARADWLESLLDSMNPEGAIVLIEPALRQTSRELLEVRDVLVSRGRGIAAPCLWRGACPALERERDWCHTERPWEPGGLVSAIADAAGRRQDRLKYSYVVLTPRADGWVEQESEEAWRVVSGPIRAKGRMSWVGCGPQGRETLTLLDRHRKKGGNALFADLERGDVIEVTQTMRKGDGLRLTPEGSLTRLWREGEAPSPE